MAIMFKNDQHRQFYEEQIEKTNSYTDRYRKAFFYALGLLEDTRRNINQLYDFEERGIDVTGLRKPWQTSGSIKVCRLAFNLYNGYTGSGKAAPLFTPYELFDSGLINYMLEAVKIRYSDYSHIEN